MKSCFNKVSGNRTQSADFVESAYLDAAKALRDLLFIPSLAKRAFQDMTVKHQESIDDIPRRDPEAYLKVNYTTRFHQFSSYQHGLETFRVIHPVGISEFPAVTDGSLQTIMASHLFQPGMMAINFGNPNVATFITEQKKDEVETVKIDAKSLWRDEMTYHGTSGKMQSGIFFVPTNLPQEALARFQETAKKMQGRKDITCVNTNCRVLKEAGFSIENVALDEVVFPNTLMEHLLFRKAFYTDLKGIKHKVHFDILNTTPRTLEQYCEEVDTAVIGTRYRHQRRNNDTEENQKTRSLIAQILIQEEKDHLASSTSMEKMESKEASLTKRKITISVPSLIGDAVARIWGRHTIFEVDLSDKRAEIAQAFAELAQRQNQKEVKLLPFPQKRPSLATRIKRDIFFSGAMIRFLRGHMMGRVDELELDADNLFRHLKTTKGERLNYVILDDKVALSRIQANGNSDEAHRRTADWALSKHALLANRQEVYCSGEIWYNEDQDRYLMNGDSGSYLPTPDHVEVAAKLANRFFGNKFLVAPQAQIESGK